MAALLCGFSQRLISMRCDAAAAPTFVALATKAGVLFAMYCPLEA
jgi:hypothetical protein